MYFDTTLNKKCVDNVAVVVHFSDESVIFTDLFLIIHFFLNITELN